MEEGRSTFKTLTDKSTGKKPSGRFKSRWEDIIRMDLKEVGVNTRNWVDSAQVRDYWRVLVNAALNLRAPKIMRLVSLGNLRLIALLIGPSKRV